MKKNVIWWVGVKSEDQSLSKKYGDYSFLEYSRKTWEYYAKKNDFHFVAYEKTSMGEESKYKINWQRWFDVYDYLDEMGIEYDQILSVDASIMAKWDYPNIFEMNDRKFSALLSIDNLKWSYQSAMGYKDLFDGFDFDISKYIGSGFVIFNESHKEFFKKLKKFYFENFDDIYNIENVTVRRGTDQPVINYMLQVEKIPTHIIPVTYGVSHLYRKELLTYNWQLNEDKTLHFIKHFYGWIFSGWPDRGETRNKLMKQTWDLVKDNYV